MKDFVQKTSKKHLIVAPTGIAAIHAGGTTIHSLFGLPLTSFVPTMEFTDRNLAINIPQLLPHFKYRKDRLKLLRTLELLIIDEVSMLRCDVLDMMDHALRTARRIPEPFGGVQLLFIGDLYQLPPVVKSASESLLYQYYRSPFFFEAQVLQAVELLTVTLTKVYRQSDPVFIQMLNAIRENDLDAVDFEGLQARYQPDFDPEDFYIHLVSHNYMAEAINRKKLAALDTKSRLYPARIQGDFKPGLFPNEEQLELKPQAQVMFIKNDSEGTKRFFNGMLATVLELGADEIKVRTRDESTVLKISRETWEQKKYRVTADNKIEEEVIGSFEQFPIKLAWAVTIHKSQGLTFDKVIIDAGRSFTSGQVYVALSRCRTLEGIVLKSLITPGAIRTDDRIRQFQQDTAAGNDISGIIATEKHELALRKLLRLLDPGLLLEEAGKWELAVEAATSLNDQITAARSREMRVRLEELHTVFEKFRVFLELQSRQGAVAVNWDTILNKSRGAVAYFFEKIQGEVLTVLKDAHGSTRGVKGLKAYNVQLKDFTEQVAGYLNALKEACLLETVLLPAAPETITAKVEKIPSHVQSYRLFEAGNDIAAIASERQISPSTVMGHLAIMAASGLVDIRRLFSEVKIDAFEAVFMQHKWEKLSDWKKVLPDDFEFAEIRLLLNHFRNLTIRVAGGD
ncbi:hypothetical protein GCM10027051_01450 [Niabella terrae]